GLIGSGTDKRLRRRLVLLCSVVPRAADISAAIEARLLHDSVIARQDVGGRHSSTCISRPHHADREGMGTCPGARNGSRYGDFRAPPGQEPLFGEDIERPVELKDAKAIAEIWATFLYRYGLIVGACLNGIQKLRNELCGAVRSWPAR